MERHRAFITLPNEVLARYLHLAPGIEVVGIQQDFASERVDIFLEGPELPIARSGEPIRRVPHATVAEWNG